MAQDIGLLLRGLGAAVSNQVPQFRQQMVADQENQMRQQEFQAQQQQRMRQDEMQNFERMRTLQAAGYQDALALTELLKPESLNVEGALGLLEDRMALMDQMDMKIPNDPTRMIYDNLRRYAGSGDPAAFRTARNTAGALVVQGLARGDIKLPEAKKPIEVGGRLVDPETYAVLYEPSTQQGLLTKSQVEALISEGYSGLDPAKQYQRSASGTISELGGSGTTINVGATTEGERKTGTLANRLDYAMSQIEDVLKKSPEASSPEMLPTLLSGAGLEMLANMTNSPQRRAIEAAQRDMLDAALTLGTGSAYTKEQLEGYRTSYFPQIGDDAALIQYKASRLQNVIDTAYDAAGMGRPEQRLSGGSEMSANWIDFPER